MESISRRLTDASVRNAKPADKARKLTDGGGLYLLVNPNGSKLWRFKFRQNGKEGLHAIGSYPDVSLSQARELHRTARAQVAAGENPVRARQAERERVAQEALHAQEGAFDTVLANWRAKDDPRRAPATIRQRDREIGKHLLTAFRGRPIGSITRVEIVKLLEPIDNATPEVARNLRSYLYAAFEHAIDKGLLNASPVPPARALRSREQVSHAAMDMGRVAEFLATLDASSAEPETKIAFKLVILTVCRKAEIIEGRWSEIDLDAGEWNIPAGRMKARSAHWVPLSRQAVSLLRELRAVTNGDLLFPNRRDPGRPMANRSLNAVLARLGFDGDATVHGFRALFSTHQNAQPGANPDVIERCLAHAPKDKVRSAYNRHEYMDERRAMLQEWANYLDGLSQQGQQQRQQFAA